MSLLCSWWKTAQALAVTCLLAMIWQVHGGKNRPLTGLAPNGVPTLSVLGNPYIRGLCEPVRRLARAYLVCFRQYLNCKILHGMDFKRFFRPKTDDLQKKKVFAEIRRLFLSEIENLRGFSDRKQVIFAEIRRLFRAGIENLSGFSGQKQVISKKKKDIGRNRKAFSGRHRKFKPFFRPKTGDFSSHKPALKSRWGDAEISMGRRSISI